ANDYLFRASQATGISIDKLATSMVQFGAPLRNIGFELEDSAALLAKWEKEGVNTELALGGLKIALGEFAKEGTDAKTGLEDLIEQITNAETAAEAMALGVTKFGSRAGPDMVAAIREGRFEFADFTEELKTGDETIASATEDTEGFGEAFKKLKNQISVAVGPIVEDFAGIATSMGNLIFLLPALTGALGRGLGALWTKAGVGRAVMAAVSFAGTAASAAYAAAASAGAALGRAIQAIWIALGAPGSRVIASAMASGRLVGIAFAAAAAAAVLAIPLLVKSDTDLASVEGRIADLKRTLDNLYDKDPFEKMAGGVVTVGEAFDTASAQLRALEMGEIALADAHREAEITTVELNTALDLLEQQAAGVADGVETTEAAVVGLGGAVSETGADVDGLDDALDALNLDAVAGDFKDLKAEIKATDKEWKELIKRGDDNKKSIKALNDEIDKWVRRYKRALRENDSEAAAYALKQISRATKEKADRKAVRELVYDEEAAVKALADAMGKTPAQVRTQFNMPGLKEALTDVKALASVLNSETVRNALAGRGIADLGGADPRFASGGHITGPSIVGENGPELYVPDRPGMIYNQQQVATMSGGGDTTVHHEHTITADGARNLRDAGFDERGVAEILHSALLGSRARFRWGV
ncbi:MAG TPA: hypothetical protein VMW48_13190, partial [Vicinamibacterales bacterium]|nr:hypothetical protein [Vicinamibacterales bacterium]